MSEIKEEINEDCPVCLCPNGELFLLSCKLHQMHLSCAQDMIKLECPLCFESVTNFPKDIIDKITERGKEYNAKLEEDDVQELRELINESSINNTSYLLQVKLEAIAAIIYLKENDVPVMYIPNRVNITVYKNTPAPPEGTYYRVIVAHAIERMYDDIMSNMIDDECEEEYNEDYDNPFNDTHIRFSINNIQVNEV